MTKTVLHIFLIILLDIERYTLGEVSNSQPYMYFLTANVSVFVLKLLCTFSQFLMNWCANEADHIREFSNEKKVRNLSKQSECANQCSNLFSKVKTVKGYASLSLEIHLKQ